MKNGRLHLLIELALDPDYKTLIATSYSCFCVESDGLDLSHLLVLVPGNSVAQFPSGDSPKQRLSHFNTGGPFPMSGWFVMAID